MTDFATLVPAPQGRFDGISRAYAPAEVERLRGSVAIEHTLAHLPANCSLAEKRQALREAYPFGPRRFWPYKVWLQEVRYALGLRKRPRRGHAAAYR